MPFKIRILARSISFLLCLTILVTLMHCGKSAFQQFKNDDDRQPPQPKSGDAIGARKDSFDHGNPEHRGPEDDSLVEETFQPSSIGGKNLDMVFALDTSGSMDDERTLLEENLQEFLDDLRSLDLDVRTIFIGKRDDIPEKLARHFNVSYDSYVGSNNAISVMNRFFVLGKQLLRSETPLEVVFMSDDNGKGKGNRAGDFKPTQKIPRIKVNAIVGEKEGRDDSNPNCHIKEVGNAYKELAEDTGGKILNICEQNWDQLLSSLRDSITANLKSELILAFEPHELTKITVVLPGETLIIDPIEEPEWISGRTLTLPGWIDLRPDQQVTVRYWKNSN